MCSIGKTVDVVVYDCFCTVRPSKLRKAAGKVFDGVIRIVILIDKACAKLIEHLSFDVVLKLPISLDICSTT
jgi:hypothetical protein